FDQRLDLGELLHPSGVQLVAARLGLLQLRQALLAIFAALLVAGIDVALDRLDGALARCDLGLLFDELFRLGAALGPHAGRPRAAVVSGRSTALSGRSRPAM